MKLVEYTDKLVEVIRSFSVTKVSHRSGTTQMCLWRRKLLSSKYMYAVFLKPCPLERAFPGIEDAGQSAQNGRKISKSDQNKDKSKLSQHTGLSRFWNTGQGEDKVKQLVQNATQLAETDNMEFLWRFYAKFLDRVLFFLHFAVTVFVFCFYLPR